MEFICGIDEVGRGSLAGPVVICAVVLPENLKINGVKDSKQLNAKQRNVLFSQIIKSCREFSMSIVDEKSIDKHNILKATMLGIEKCIKSLKNHRKIKLFIDGNYLKLNSNLEKKLNYSLIVKGDSKVFAISCASILAKVLRDNLMISYNEKYPDYNFQQNKGYPTKRHIEVIRKFGISEIHRKSFCGKFY
jgi:ribonuclease HII